jgi:hypothetical protein
MFNVLNGSCGVLFSASDNVARRCATGGRLGMMLIDNVNSATSKAQLFPLCHRRPAILWIQAQEWAHGALSLRDEDAGDARV